MNFSTRSASLSLGGPGATVNLSSRGTRATLGLPGTGFSYTSSASSSAGARRRSAQQIAAEHRRFAQQQQRVAALAHIERIEAELEETLNAWRSELNVCAPSTFGAMLTVQPFVNPEAAPSAPDFLSAEKTCRANAAAAVQRAHPMKGYRRAAWLIGFLAGSLALLVVGPFALLVSAVGSVVAQSMAKRRWLRELEPLCLERGNREWTTARTGLQADFEKASDAFAERSRWAEREWQGQERARVENVRRLISGEPEVVEASVSAVLQELDFPFETECEILVDDEDHVMIDVDLPEIEDAVPEMQYKVLKNGSLKQTKRKVSERNRAYAELVCGITLAIAAASLSAGPTLTHVTVAGRTQRQKQNAKDIEDVYVIEVKVPREIFAKLNAPELDPIELIDQIPSSRMQLSANHSLKKISAPSWRR